MSLVKRRQNAGAALLAAMLTVTLVAALASTALWQQWQSVETETAERSRVQAAWVLVGALDWARLILMEDARAGGADHLAEPWAVKLNETRLSSFLAADKDNAAQSSAEQLDVFLSGNIEDMQSRMNLRNLVDAEAVSQADLQAFSRLFEVLQLPRSELTQLAEKMRTASLSDAGPPAQSLMPQRMAQLQWMGLSESSIARLGPHAGLLPARTPVNLNTASAEVVYASVAGLTMADAQRLVEQRSAKPFLDLGAATRILGGSADRLSEGRHSVSSSFFEIHGRLRLEGTLIEETSLVKREGLNIKTLWRERAALPVIRAAQKQVSLAHQRKAHA